MIYDHYWRCLIEKQRNDPHWDPDNHATWDEVFGRYRDAELKRYDGNCPLPRNRNADGRMAWWSEPGRMLDAVLADIKAVKWEPIMAAVKSVNKAPSLGDILRPIKLEM